MLNTTLTPEPSRTISRYAKRQLSEALKADYSFRITGFLVDAHVVANAAVGVVYADARRDGTGRFDDGHLIRTSDVLDIRQFDGRWLIQTLNSTYVIVTFKQHVGRRSLETFLAMQSKVFIASKRLH